MLTPEDIKNLTEYQKLVFVTKADFEIGIEKLHQGFNELQTSVLSFAAGTKKNSDEILAVNNRVSTTENWVKRASPKIGLDYKP